MPTTPHVEKHFTAGNTARAIVIGMSDGLTALLPWRRAAPAQPAFLLDRLIG